MDQAAWKRTIIKAMKLAGTYQKFFEPVVNTLAGILERRDQTQEMYVASGGTPLVRHTNKGGATNIEQNPALRLINDLNRDALAYWRDLGLTPAGLKKINEAALQKPKTSALAEALKDLG